MEIFKILFSYSFLNFFFSSGEKSSFKKIASSFTVKIPVKQKRCFYRKFTSQTYALLPRKLFSSD